MNHAIFTGCAGFVGSELTRQLLERGCKVMGLDNFSRGTEAHIAGFADHSQFRLLRGDIRSEEDLRRAFKEKPDVVFHLAARHFIPECIADPAGTFDINTVGSLRVWDMAVRSGAKRFLFVSTGDVYGPSREPHAETDATEPFNPYGLSKLTTERALAMQGSNGVPEFLTVRLFNVYGPGETNLHLLPEILGQVRCGLRTIELGNLWPVRDYIFVRDAAEALIRLMEAHTVPDVVNVGTGGGWSVAELVSLVAEATDLPIVAQSVSQKRRPVERDVLRPDTTTLTATTGWRPSRQFVDGLRETFEATPHPPLPREGGVGAV